MKTTIKKEWYKDLDISSMGQPMGIEPIDGLLTTGICYCIISNNTDIEQVDVYKEGQKIHYKRFTFDSLGRVIENTMYSPDGKGGWHIADDVWHYEYHPEAGYRTKKIIKTPGSEVAKEISYDKSGNRTGERVIAIAS